MCIVDPGSIKWQALSFNQPCMSLRMLCLQNARWGAIWPSVTSADTHWDFHPAGWPVVTGPCSCPYNPLSSFQGHIKPAGSLSICHWGICFSIEFPAIKTLWTLLSPHAQSDFHLRVHINLRFCHSLLACGRLLKASPSLSVKWQVPKLHPHFFFLF